MSHNLRRCVLVTLAVVGVFLAIFTVQAAFMHGYLKMVAESSNIDRRYALTFLAFLLLVTSNVVPSLVLRVLRVRRIGAYVFVGLVSGLLATFCFVDAWGTTENAGAILHHVQTATGWSYAAPSLAEILIDQSRSVVRLVADIPDDLSNLHYSLRMLGSVLMLGIFGPAPFGVVFGAFYWRILVRRATRASAQ